MSSRIVRLGCALALLGCSVSLAGCDRATVIVEQPDAPATTAELERERERDAVREAVSLYARALEARDPAAATRIVVTETFELYEDLRLLAKSAARAQLENSDLMTVMLVLQIRARFPRAELEAVDGRTLFERAVEAGLVGDALDDVALDGVWLDDAGVHAEIRIEDEPIVWLRKQDAQWRVDIPEMVRVLGPAIEEIAREGVLADGKLRTAWSFIEVSSEESVDIAVLDGPLE
jgi:hypothetical protein